MDDNDQLRSQLALACAFGQACFLQAFPAKSPPIAAPTPRQDRTAREACGGRDPTMRWTDVPFVVIDTETTGTDPTADRAIELAFVHSDGREWSTMLNPGVAIPPGAQAVHGITDADLAHAPTFGEAWQRAAAAGLLDAHPLAYCATFDGPLVAVELVRAGLVDAAQALADVEWFDPLVMVREVEKYAKGKKLEDACARRGIVIDGAHRALADARATRELWRRLLSERAVPASVTGLASFLRHQRDRRKAQDEDFARWQAKQQRGRAA